MRSGIGGSAKLARWGRRSLLWAVAWSVLTASCTQGVESDQGSMEPQVDRWTHSCRADLTVVDWTADAEVVMSSLDDAGSECAQMLDSLPAASNDAVVGAIVLFGEDAVVLPDDTTEERLERLRNSALVGYSVEVHEGGCSGLELTGATRIRFSESPGSGVMEAAFDASFVAGVEETIVDGARVAVADGRGESCSVAWVVDGSSGVVVLAPSATEAIEMLSS